MDGHMVGGIALCGVGAAGIVDTILDLRRWRATPGWPTADGRVLSSHVEAQHPGQDDYTEKLRFEYEFHVDGLRYTGRRIRAGQELDLTVGGGPGYAWSTARGDAGRYPPGSPVYVRYDPRNPKRCCLRTGGLPGILAKLAFCIGLLLGGGVLIRKSLG